MIPLKIFVYMCIFIAMECMIVGFVNLLNPKVPWEQRKGGLMFSYVWMIPVYLIFPFVFEIFTWIYNLTHFNFIFIILINYVFGVLFVTGLEAALGAILEKSIGFCPWKNYTDPSRQILGGFSRWDWSLMYGLITVLFYYFIQYFNWVV